MNQDASALLVFANVDMLSNIMEVDPNAEILMSLYLSCKACKTLLDLSSTLDIMRRLIHTYHEASSFSKLVKYYFMYHIGKLSRKYLTLYECCIMTIDAENLSLFQYMISHYPQDRVPIRGLQEHCASRKAYTLLDWLKRNYSLCAWYTVPPPISSEHQRYQDYTAEQLTLGYARGYISVDALISSDKLPVIQYLWEQNNIAKLDILQQHIGYSSDGVDWIISQLLTGIHDDLLTDGWRLLVQNYDYEDAHTWFDMLWDYNPDLIDTWDNFVFTVNGGISKFAKLMYERNKYQLDRMRGVEDIAYGAVYKTIFDFLLSIGYDDYLLMFKSLASGRCIEQIMVILDMKVLDEAECLTIAIQNRYMDLAQVLLNRGNQFQSEHIFGIAYFNDLTWLSQFIQAVPDSDYYGAILYRLDVDQHFSYRENDSQYSITEVNAHNRTLPIIRQLAAYLKPDQDCSEAIHLATRLNRTDIVKCLYELHPITDMKQIFEWALQTYINLELIEWCLERGLRLSSAEIEQLASEYHINLLSLIHRYH